MSKLTTSLEKQNKQNHQEKQNIQNHQEKQNIQNHQEIKNLHDELPKTIIDISEVFDYNGYLIKIKKCDDESREVYLNRVDYILTNYDQHNKESIKSNLDYVIRISLIWRNIKMFGMVYPLSVTKKLF
jgi:uncharacterized FlaG/YvyC family protein